MRAYVWFVLKNVLGWLLIIAAFVAGPLVPGPGGLPLFFIGFGLITFPGKRQMTARMLYGKPIAPDSRVFQRAVAGVSVVLPAVGIWYLTAQGYLPSRDSTARGLLAVFVYVMSALAVWWVGLRSLWLVNKLLRIPPRMRRKFRPWLRRRGIDLLPRRRRRRRVAGGPVTREPDEEILEIHPRHITRASNAWTASLPWLKRALGLAMTAAIFIWIFEPAVRNWNEVQVWSWRVDWVRFFTAAAMFAVFLFAARAMVWRQVLSGLGHRVPAMPAARIWSTSELARYLPGAVWQVVGRVYLVKPYGVRGSICTASQVIELTIFLLANLLVALGCLLWFGVKQFGGGAAETWLYVAMALTPVLALLLHPKVLYQVLNKILVRLNKPPVTQQMSFVYLLGLLAWAVAGVLFQSLALWLLVSGDPTISESLPLSKWWVVAGCYSLAWTAGFLAIWAPGGLGVRELVFVAAMKVGLRDTDIVRYSLFDPGGLEAYLAFLSVLLRLWTIVGELMLAAVAYVSDYRGALGRPDAPGRRPLARPPPPPPAAEAPAFPVVVEEAK